MSRAHWCVIPAAGRGARFGGDIPKQYLEVAGRTVLMHTLDALLSHPRIAGAMVAVSAGDVRWAAGEPGLHGKPVLTCIGGDSRAASVANALAALPSYWPPKLVFRWAMMVPTLASGFLARKSSMALRSSDSVICFGPYEERIDSSVSAALVR